MSTLIEINIKNFRGIEDLTIDFDSRRVTDVITLIGLNESGKTTILEALSHFSTADRTIPNLLAEDENDKHMLSIIPIDQRARFSDSVRITAKVRVERSEWEEIERAASKKFSTNVRLSQEESTLIV
ncbi:MAG: AAA family ATPase, partial [Pseudomonadota bacterium]